MADPAVENAIRLARAYLDFHRPRLDKRNVLHEQTVYLDGAGEDLRGTIWGDYRTHVLQTGSTTRTKKGPSKHDYRDRDLCIQEAVQLVHDSCGFSFTRSSATADRESACSIVKQALERLDDKAGKKAGMAEDAINKIWSRRRKPPKPTQSEK